jgi:hypothetical protein
VSRPIPLHPIRAAYGSEVPASEGAGVAGGDIISLGNIDANELVDDYQRFIFGGRDTGHLWLAENGTRTVICGNTDADAAPELKIVIADVSVRASDYWGEDFSL